MCGRRGAAPGPDPGRGSPAVVTDMAAIRYFDPGEADFADPVDVYPQDVVALVPDAELVGTRVRMHHPGTATDPQLFEVEVDPDVVLAPHAHLSTEIIVVVRGTLQVGGRRLTPGCSMVVSAETPYSLRAGPDGATFLNFRGTADYTYLDPASLVSRRRSLVGRSSPGDRSDHG